MKMKNNLILLILFLSSSLLSQNILFENNSSGFHLAGQISSNNGSTLIGISPGFTSNGKLTIGVTLGLEENDNLEGSSTAIKPYLSYLVMKQGNDNPISVALNASFQHNTFSEYDDLSANTVGLGAGLFHQIKAGKNFDIIPGAGVGWGRRTVKIFESSESDSAISYGLNVTAKIKKFYVTPSLTFSEGNSHFDLIFGIIFPN